VSSSTNKGQTWSADIRTITNAKNPALAVNSAGLLGLAHQQFTGATWDTKLELTSNNWGSAITPLMLHTAPSNAPTPPQFLPYLGDYIRLLSIGADFYGVFSGNSTPNMGNFPNGVTYQRNADWTNHRLLANDNTTVVPISIDPFFYHWSQILIPRTITPRPSPIPPRPITRTPIQRGPIAPRPPTPPQPPEPPEPIQVGAKKSGKKPASKRGPAKKAANKKAKKRPTKLDL
jgi:hypothetical protein